MYSGAPFCCTTGPQGCSRPCVSPGSENSSLDLLKPVVLIRTVVFLRIYETMLTHRLGANDKRVPCKGMNQVSF